MSLSNALVRATVAVSDFDAAVRFYEGTLGLSPLGDEDGMEGIRMYSCGQDSLLQVYASEHAGGTTATVASWSAENFDSTVEELRTRGVSFETTDEPPSDGTGVHTFGEHKVAWFKDPDGNTLALDNGRPPS